LEKPGRGLQAPLFFKEDRMQEVARYRVISGARERSTAAIGERALRAASGFTALGVKAGDAIALVLRNDFPAFEATFAAMRLSAYCVPINWHGKAAEIAYVLSDCGAKVVIAHADLLEQVIPALGAGMTLLVVPTPEEIASAYQIAPERCTGPDDANLWETFLAQHAPMPLGAGGGSSMIYTSGTTGHPKGVRRVPLDEDTAAAVARLAKDVFGVFPGCGIRTVITGPLYHSAPNFFGLAAVRDGDLVVLQPRFDAEELLRLISQYRITHLHMVPTMFVRLLRLPEAVKRQYDVSSLQWVAHAAAPCPVDIKRQMIEWWGPVIVEYYGGTEMGAVAFHTAPEALAKPGTVGRARPGATIRIYDEEGNLQPPGEIGEVYGWAENWPDFTYHGMPERRKECSRDGLVSIGDVGYLDADGYLFLCDRKRDMVIFAGTNIYPAEIEAVLLAMPAVDDCAVFGIPDDEYGERLAAHIMPQRGMTLDATAVRDFLRDRVASYKVPHVIKFESDLPREDSGKIMKRKLRDPYWASVRRQI
jgi:long-chain acyl-CoA synthetase